MSPPQAKYNVPAELKAKEVQAEQAAAQLLQQQEEQEVDELEAAGLKRARKNNKGEKHAWIAPMADYARSNYHLC